MTIFVACVLYHQASYIPGLSVCPPHICGQRRIITESASPIVLDTIQQPFDPDRHALDQRSLAQDYLGFHCFFAPSIVIMAAETEG